MHPDLTKTDYTLMHMLGINDPYCHSRTHELSRNYAAANKNDEHYTELVADGLIEITQEDEAYDWFRCTDKGQRRAWAAQLRIRKPAYQRLVRAYDDVVDVINDLDFAVFFHSPDFADSRVKAVGYDPTQILCRCPECGSQHLDRWETTCARYDSERGVWLTSSENCQITCRDCHHMADDEAFAWLPEPEDHLEDG
jgi:hypothetical protein